LEFRWIEWNIDHIANHGVTPDEAERVIKNARPPFPERLEDDKWLVIGRGGRGRFIQVIFVLDEHGTVFVIHSRPLTDKEKRRYRRRIR
jgi:uncharacterized DUF497 family protein